MPSHPSPRPTNPCFPVSPRVRPRSVAAGEEPWKGFELVERPCDSTQLLERPGHGPASLRASAGGRWARKPRGYTRRNLPVHC